MPILITGAAGFAGSYLVELLTKRGAEVVAWHRPGGRLPFASPRTTWQEVDLLDFDAVTRAIDQARPTRVYHCAGAPHVGRSWDATDRTFAVNVRGTHYLFEALRRCAVEARVLISSSAMVYRPTGESIQEEHPLVPPNPYGLSKLAQELLGQRASSSRLTVTVGRAFNHIGPRQDPSFAASGFARQIAEIELRLREPEVVVGNLEARRDTVDVRDTVRAYEAILEHGASGRPYNISSGRASPLREILEMLIARATSPVRIVVDKSRFRPHDAPIMVGDSRRLRDELGWAPMIPLSQTLEDLLAYWRAAVRELRPSL
jgi:GDP-4-dehydro-6-deoxy-D-mannose reductase